MKELGDKIKNEFNKYTILKLYLDFEVNVETSPNSDLIIVVKY